MNLIWMKHLPSANILKIEQIYFGCYLISLLLKKKKRKGTEVTDRQEQIHELDNNANLKESLFPHFLVIYDLWYDIVYTSSSCSFFFRRSFFFNSTFFVDSLFLQNRFPLIFLFFFWYGRTVYLYKKKMIVFTFFQKNINLYQCQESYQCYKCI